MSVPFNRLFVSLSPQPAQTARARSILFVEEDPVLRGLSLTVLCRAGYRVKVAEDGQAAWDALQLGHYDLLITAHQMNRLSGLELVLRLRGLGRSMPVVMAADGAEAGKVAGHSWLQLSAVLRRPYSPRHLLHAAAEALRSPQPLAQGGDLILPGIMQSSSIPRLRGWGLSE